MPGAALGAAALFHLGLEHVPLPVASALSDLLRDHGFRNLMIRQAVPRKH